MNNEDKASFKDPCVIFLSFFGTGFSPYAPGTVGTFACLPLFYGLGLLQAPKFLFLPFVIILTILSCYIAEITQKKYEIHDPSWIVLDEVLGLAVAWLFLSQYSIVALASAAALFRLFDIVKVWPASFFDRLDHGSGTILDDIVAGIYAGLTFLLFTWLSQLV